MQIDLSSISFFHSSVTSVTMVVIVVCTAVCISIVCSVSTMSGMSGVGRMSCGMANWMVHHLTMVVVLDFTVRIIHRVILTMSVVHMVMMHVSSDIGHPLNLVVSILV